MAILLQNSVSILQATSQTYFPSIFPLHVFTPFSLSFLILLSLSLFLASVSQHLYLISLHFLILFSHLSLTFLTPFLHSSFSLSTLALISLPLSLSTSSLPSPTLCTHFLSQLPLSDQFNSYSHWKQRNHGFE